MKLKQLTYGDSEALEEIVVSMSIDEAAFIEKTLGSQRGVDAEAIMPDGPFLGGAIFDCLTSVFNRHWDDGVDEYLDGV